MALCYPCNVALWYSSLCVLCLYIIITWKWADLSSWMPASSSHSFALIDVNSNKGLTVFVWDLQFFYLRLTTLPGTCFCKHLPGREGIREGVREVLSGCDEGERGETGTAKNTRLGKKQKGGGLVMYELHTVRNDVWGERERKGEIKTQQSRAWIEDKA